MAICAPSAIPPGLLLLIVLLALFFTTAAASSPLSSIFTPSEIAGCGKIRIPELVLTPSRILAFGQCRDFKPQPQQHRGFGDNMLHAKVVSKASSDGGITWENYTIHSPRTGFSHGAPIYDAVMKQVILQYQYHPQALPEDNSSTFQKISEDDGLSWGAPRDITDQLNGCNPFRPVQMQVESAGSKIQTSSGRLLFTGHSYHNDSCVWYSDDHGQTYQSAARFVGNEVSMAEVSPGRLVMNGRGTQFPWHPHRAHYESMDDGSTWSVGTKSELVGINCEGALIAVKPAAATVKCMNSTDDWKCHSQCEPCFHQPCGCPDGCRAVNACGCCEPVAKPLSDNSMATLYFSEPVGEGRTSLVLRCSHDGGKTWPGTRAVNGNNKAAYSALLELPEAVDSGAAKKKILVVWELGPNFVAQQVGVKWCMKHAPRDQRSI